MAGPLRVNSGRPEKLLVRKSLLATTPQTYWGTFDWRSMKVLPGLVSDVTITRQGNEDGIGKLSTKLLFGSKRQIVLVAGKQYEYRDQFEQSNSTTYVKVVLDRVG
jgi:hypothetical protein